MVSFINRIFPALVVLTIALCAVSLGMIFFYAPVEAQMGIVQKIFYVHVPAAMAAYAGFTICSLCSLVYLWQRRPSPKLDAAAQAGAEIGMVFCLYMMISGPLWGYKAWGKFWVWDPQLTASFVLTMLYGGYIILRRLSPSPRMRKNAAVLAVFAFLDIPVIHYAVRKWGGLHPQVERSGGGGLAPEMKLVFSLCMLAFLLLFLVLFWLDVRRRMLKLDVDQMHLDLADLQLIRTASQP